MLQVAFRMSAKSFKPMRTQIDRSSHLISLETWMTFFRIRVRALPFESRSIFSSHYLLWPYPLFNVKTKWQVASKTSCLPSCRSVFRSTSKRSFMYLLSPTSPVLGAASSWSALPHLWKIPPMVNMSTASTHAHDRWPQCIIWSSIQLW